MSEAMIWIFGTSLLLCWAAAQEYLGDQCIDEIGRYGVCKIFRDCDIANEEFVKYKTISFCRTPDYQSIVCCPHQPMLSPPTTAAPIRWYTHPSPWSAITNQPVIVPGLPEGPVPLAGDSPPIQNPPSEKYSHILPGDRAKHYCNGYKTICEPGGGIAGGESVLPGEYPHMAAIGYGEYNNIIWGCGGSLISEKFILTVAHCLRSNREGEAKWVLLGTVNLPANPSLLGDDGQIHEVVRRIPHPAYRRTERYNDIGLIEIGPALTRNPRPLHCEVLHPACLKTDDSFYKPSYIAAGWGRIQEGGIASKELLYVRLNTIDQITCNQTYQAQIKVNDRLKRGIVSTMLCAGYLKGGKDTCQGDSGGPLQIPTFSTCLYEIVGITSFGRICGSPNSPSVYTKVSSFIEWLENIVWPLDSN